MLVKMIIAAAAALTLTGCVSAPSSIPASYVDQNKFAALSCDESIAQKQAKELDLADLSKKQSASRTRGMVYNTFLIVGAGALTKDRSDEIGEMKGDIAALNAQALRSCGSTGTPADGTAG